MAFIISAGADSSISCLICFHSLFFFLFWLWQVMECYSTTLSTLIFSFIVFTPAAEMRTWIQLTLIKRSHLFDSKMNNCLASNVVVTISTICAYQYLRIVPGMCHYSGFHTTWWYISDISQSLILHICCRYFPSVSSHVYLYKLAQNLTITSINHILQSS